MPAHVKVLTVCLLSLVVLSCSGRSVYAPIDSRSNTGHSDSSSSVTSRPAKTGRSYSSSGATYHTVKSGDTLYSISKKYGMEYWQLASINGIKPPFTVYKGQRLSLRGKATAAASKPKAGKPKSASTPKVTANQTTAKTGTQVKFDGKWKWPVRGRLLRGYKPNEPGKKGINIGGHSGQPVKAAASGKVVYVGSGLVGYGRLIIIRHNEHLLSTYGHNSKLLVAEGEHVKTGQTIAKMGSSGTSRTELYFEIRKDGKPVNPLVYLPKKH
jgi:lipoprotein NlpD